MNKFENSINSDYLKDKLRVAVIGVGYLGKFHAEKYAQMDHVDLVGVVDVNKTRADAVGKHLGVKSYLNYQDLMGIVDAVSIVVPTPLHFPISKQFLENDVDLLIEKPMTTTLEEADALIQISEERGRIIQVGHLERFNPAVVALQNFINKPIFIESHRLSIFKERGVDVSVVLDLMIHDIDIITNFVQSEIERISAAGAPVICDHVDIANARLEFANGCVANVTASRISMKNERKIRLFQKDAYVSVDFANHEITVVQRDGNKTNGLIPGMDIKQQSFEKGDALEDELKSFVNAVVRRERPLVTGRMGRDALKIALNIMDQINTSPNRLLYS
ncbi:Gfo/Idh/MocA family protein [Thermodesulfobacteriota bacterium]